MRSHRVPHSSPDVITDVITDVCAYDGTHGGADCCPNACAFASLRRGREFLRVCNERVPRVRRRLSHRPVPLRLWS